MCITDLTLVTIGLKLEDMTDHEYMLQKRITRSLGSRGKAWSQKNKPLPNERLPMSQILTDLQQWNVELPF